MKLNKHFTTKNLFWFGLIKKAIFLLFIIFTSLGKASENTNIDSANAEYAKGNYAKAAQLYESVIHSGWEAPELYFNLGNAYFKSKNISKAIINYERAKKLKPNDEDILVNLKLANQQIEDKIDEAPQLFFKEWQHGITDMMTEKGWSILMIILFITSLLLFAMYYASAKRVLKQVGFFGGAILLIVSVVLFFIAKQKYTHTQYSNEAIITSASVTVTGSPNEKGTKLFILHEGTKVNITQESDSWTEIKIANGNVGWVKSKQLESI